MSVFNVATKYRYSLILGRSPFMLNCIIFRSFVGFGLDGLRVSFLFGW